MKTIKMFTLVLFASAMIGISTPVLAQDTPTASAQTRSDDHDDDDDDTNYSWIGLFGLIGLAGLLRKDKDVTITRGTHAATGTSYTP